MYDHFIVLLPLSFQLTTYLSFGFGIDQVDTYLVCLKEPSQSVNILYEIIELKPDAQIDCPVTMPLQVAPASQHDRLGADLLDQPVGEARNSYFPLLKVLASVNGSYSEDSLLNRLSLRLEVVPDDSMGFWILSAELEHFIDARHKTLPLFPGTVLDAAGDVFEHSALAVLFRYRRAVIRWQFVPADIQRGQLVAGIVSRVAGQIRWLYNE